MSDPVVHTPEKADVAGLHVAEFLDAVRTRKQPSCLIEDAFQSTGTVQLGMISYGSSGPVVWDMENEDIPDNPKARELLKREYRAPWQHPCTL